MFTWAATRSFALAFHLRYFAPPVLAFGDAAGEGLTAGLTLAAGALPVSPAGEGELDGDELAVPGEVELLSGSVAQPAANIIEDVARSRSAVRLIKFILGVVIIFPRQNKIEKRVDDYSGGN
jgi:hypothetical protein